MRDFQQEERGGELNERCRIKPLVPIKLPHTDSMLAVTETNRTTSGQVCGVAELLTANSHLFGLVEIKEPQVS